MKDVLAWAAVLILAYGMAPQADAADFELGITADHGENSAFRAGLVMAVCSAEYNDTQLRGDCYCNGVAQSRRAASLYGLDEDSWWLNPDTCKANDIFGRTWRWGDPSISRICDPPVLAGDVCRDAEGQCWRFNSDNVTRSDCPEAA